MKQILVIDDSETARRFHADVLESAGMNVVTASNGAEGLERLFSGEFDLVLSDVNMPGMDGYEFSRRVRLEPLYDGIPIILVSTESGARDKARGIAAGANLYVVKPVSPDVLLAHVDLVLS